MSGSQVRRLWMIIMLVFFIIGCSMPQRLVTSEPAAGNRVDTLDDKFVAIAERQPGFGGMYFDEEGDLVVYMLDTDEPLSVHAEEVRRAGIESVIIDELGEEFFKVQSSLARAPKVRIIQGKYDVRLLAKWRSSAAQTLGHKGVVFTDLDESKNRVRIGIESLTIRDQVEELLQDLNIPLEAVVIEEVEFANIFATLADHHRPVQGGVKVEADTGVFAGKSCTLGFHAIRGEARGFVTNSHCTEKQGAVENTDFHQPNDPLLSEANKIGDEIADPPYFNVCLGAFCGDGCPMSRRCRVSDSAFIEYEEGVVIGRGISRTVAQDGSNTIDNVQPSFVVNSELAWPVVGTRVHKVGQVTGRTSGVVRDTCMRENQRGSNVTLLCSYRAWGTSSSTMSSPGDSGAPVFVWPGAGDDVVLVGLLWGGGSQFFAFDPLVGIERDLGPLTTSNFPTPEPSPPPQCSSGEKCCGFINGDSACVGQCVPTDASCP